MVVAGNNNIIIFYRDRITFMRMRRCRALLNYISDPRIRAVCKVQWLNHSLQYNRVTYGQHYRLFCIIDFIATQ